MAAAIFGGVALGIAGLAATARYFAVARDDDDHEDEARETNEHNERRESLPPSSTPAPQPTTGAPR
jgi:hypothetical protein